MGHIAVTLRYYEKWKLWKKTINKKKKEKKDTNPERQADGTDCFLSTQKHSTRFFNAWYTYVDKIQQNYSSTLLYNLQFVFGISKILTNQKWKDLPVDEPFVR